MRRRSAQSFGWRTAARMMSVTSARAGVLALAAVLAFVVVVTAGQPAQAAALAAPTGVRATPNGNGVYVTFMSVQGATAYEVWRDGLRLGRTSTTQFADDTTTRGQHYTYTVRATSSFGYSAFARARLTQWTDDGSRTWLPSRFGPALCGRTGDVHARRIICTVQTPTGWQIDRVTNNVAWGNPGNQAWFTARGKINYCNLIGSRPRSTKVACLELGETGWGQQSTSPVTDWGAATNRTWLPSDSGPALCSRTETEAGHGLVCTVRTDDGWKTYRTEHVVDWGYSKNRTWLTVNGKINYCATVGRAPANTRAACVELGTNGWSKQSVSPVSDWGRSTNRTWLPSRRGPALCARTEAGGSRSIVCSRRTSQGWRTDRAPGTVDWGYDQYRAWLSVRGDIDYCSLVGDIPDNTRVACLELGDDGWGKQTVSPITDWGDPTNRTWMVGRDGPALCGRTGQQPDGRVACTVQTDQGWRIFRSPKAVDWGYEAERAWVGDGEKIGYCDQVGDWARDQRVACLDLGTDGWGEQIISATTDWGDNMP